MYGDFPAKNTVCAPYIPLNVWFWPILEMCNHRAIFYEKQRGQEKYLFAIRGDDSHAAPPKWTNVALN
jgi:hypothetical protein